MPAMPASNRWDDYRRRRLAQLASPPPLVVTPTPRPPVAQTADLRFYEQNVNLPAPPRAFPSPHQPDLRGVGPRPPVVVNAQPAPAPRAMPVPGGAQALIGPITPTGALPPELAAMILAAAEQASVQPLPPGMAAPPSPATDAQRRAAGERVAQGLAQGPEYDPAAEPIDPERVRRRMQAEQRAIQLGLDAATVRAMTDLQLSQELAMADEPLIEEIAGAVGDIGGAVVGTVVDDPSALVPNQPLIATGPGQVVAPAGDLSAPAVVDDVLAFADEQATRAGHWIERELGELVTDYPNIGRVIAALNVPFEHSIDLIGTTLYSFATGGATVMPGLPGTAPDAAITDPAARQAIIDVYENGYTAPDGTHFEPGGRAVWEMSVGKTDEWPWLPRLIFHTVTTIAADPLSYIPGVAALGRGKKVAAVTEAVQTGAPVSRRAWIAGSILEAPDVLLRYTADLPFTLLAKGIERGLQKLGLKSLKELAPDEQERLIVEARADALRQYEAASLLPPGQQGPPAPGQPTQGPAPSGAAPTTPPPPPPAAGVPPVPPTGPRPPTSGQPSVGATATVPPVPPVAPAVTQPATPPTTGSVNVGPVTPPPAAVVPPPSAAQPPTVVVPTTGGAPPATSAVPPSPTGSVITRQPPGWSIRPNPAKRGLLRSVIARDYPDAWNRITSGPFGQWSTSAWEPRLAQLTDTVDEVLHQGEWFARLRTALDAEGLPLPKIERVTDRRGQREYRGDAGIIEELIAAPNEAAAKPLRQQLHQRGVIREPRPNDDALRQFIIAGALPDELVGVKRGGRRQPDGTITGQTTITQAWLDGRAPSQRSAAADFILGTEKQARRYEQIMGLRQRIHGQPARVAAAQPELLPVTPEPTTAVAPRRPSLRGEITEDWYRDVEQVARTETNRPVRIVGGQRGDRLLVIGSGRPGEPGTAVFTSVENIGEGTRTVFADVYGTQGKTRVEFPAAAAPEGFEEAARYVDYLLDSPDPGDATTFPIWRTAGPVEEGDVAARAATDATAAALEPAITYTELKDGRVTAHFTDADSKQRVMGPYRSRGVAVSQATRKLEKVARERAVREGDAPASSLIEGPAAAQTPVETAPEPPPLTEVPARVQDVPVELAVEEKGFVRGRAVIGDRTVHQRVTFNPERLADPEKYARNQRNWIEVDVAGEQIGSAGSLDMMLNRAKAGRRAGVAEAQRVPPPAAQAASVETVPTPQGPQVVLPGTEEARRPVVGGESSGIEVPPQTTTPPLTLEAQVLDTPEAQREAQVLAGQQALFAAPELPETAVTRMAERVRRRQQPAEPSAPSVAEVPTASIRTDEASFQPREGLDPVRVRGIIESYDRRRFEPISVWRGPDDQLYVLSGHHRLAAARELGLERVPVTEFVGTREEARSFADFANAIKPLSPTENAGVVRRAVEERGQSPAQVAAQLGISEARAQQFLDLSYAPSDVADLVNANQLTPAQGAAMGRAVRERGIDPAQVSAIFTRLSQTGKIPNAAALDHIFSGAEHLAGKQVSLGDLFGDTAVESARGRFLINELTNLGSRVDSLRKLDATIARAERLAGTEAIELPDLTTTRAQIAAEIAEAESRLGRRAVPGSAPSTDALYLLNPATRRAMQTVDRITSAFTPRLPEPARLTPPPGVVPGSKLHVGWETGVIDEDAAHLLAELPGVRAGDFDQMPVGMQKGDAIDWTIADIYDHLRTAEGKSADDAIAWIDAFFRAKNEPDWGKRKAAIQRNLRRYDAVSNAIRENIQFNAVTGYRGIVNDQADVWKMTVLGHGGAALRSSDPRFWPTVYAAASGNDRDLLRALPGGDLFARLDIEIPGTVMATDRAEVGGLGREMGFHRALRGLGVPTSLAQASGLVASRRIRDARYAMDVNRRFATAVSQIEQGLPEAITTLRQLANQRARHLGRTPAELQTMIDSLGPSFSPADVLRVTRDNDLAQQWRHQVKQLQTNAGKEVDRILFSYRATNADTKLRRAFFFHYWTTRELVLHSKMVLANPWVAATYIRAYEGIQRAAERDDIPDYLKTAVRFAGDQAGWMWLLEPLAVAVPFGIAWDVAGANGEGNIFDTYIRELGFLNPLFEASMMAVGLFHGGRIPDVTGTRALRNMVRSFLDWDRNHGNTFGLGAGITDDVVDGFVGRVLDHSSSLLERLGAPFVSGQPDLDPNRFEHSTLSAVVIEHANERWGPWEQMTEDQQNAVIEATTAIKTGTVESTSWVYPGVEELARSALAEWSTIKFAGRGLSTVFPGGTWTRYGPRDTRARESSAFFEKLAAGQPATPEERAAATEKRVQDAGSEAAARLAIESEGYGQIGTPRERVNARIWNGIVYGGLEHYLIVNGRLVMPSEIEPLTREQRIQLANLYVTQTPGALEQHQAYSDARRAYREAHPDTALYHTYLGNLPDDDRAIELVAQQEAQRNPNFRRAYEQAVRDGKDIADWMPGQAAYLAVLGEQESVYDPTTLPTGGSPLLEPKGEGGNIRQPASPAAKIEADLADYQAQLTILDATVRQITGGIPYAGLDLFSKQAIDAQLAALGIDVPSLGRDTTLYLLWAAQQPQGSDAAASAYVAWKDAQQAAAGVGVAPGIGTGAGDAPMAGNLTGIIAALMAGGGYGGGTVLGRTYNSSAGPGGSVIGRDGGGGNLSLLYRRTGSAGPGGSVIGR